MNYFDHVEIPDYPEGFGSTSRSSIDAAIRKHEREGKHPPRIYPFGDDGVSITGLLDTLEICGQLFSQNIAEDLTFKDDELRRVCLAAYRLRCVALSRLGFFECRFWPEPYVRVDGGTVYCGECGDPVSRDYAFEVESAYFHCETCSEDPDCSAL